RGVLPISPNRCPSVAETFLIGVTVLRDDRCDPLRMADGEPKARRRAVVECINCEAVEAAFCHSPIPFVKSMNEQATTKLIGLSVSGIFLMMLILRAVTHLNPLPR